MCAHSHVCTPVHVCECIALCVSMECVHLPATHAACGSFTGIVRTRQGALFPLCLPGAAFHPRRTRQAGSVGCWVGIDWMTWVERREGTQPFMVTFCTGGTGKLWWFRDILHTACLSLFLSLSKWENVLIGRQRG